MIKPATPCTLFLTTKDLCALLPFSERKIRTMIADGDFPPPVSLLKGGRRLGKDTWRTSDVLEWYVSLQPQYPTRKNG